ncbi:integrin-linked kinase-associated serine/threonine phosphatase 2C isoform X3 [Leucoraja erinacea]|uniref:integrin-linked kinase-associated serine/threonine phosphatase 2C isoform X3 n=1 Tax=Leucoraja erinaceus TaxID=7782 RepID=UPI002456602D|nr:integrin-linked kinase-associated serine/threonine phosphatase 2C isoform X3 [Leucoraja erinacea]
MDLFEDLPDPGVVAQKSKPLLFDDLPRNPDVASSVPDLFGELPETQNDLKAEKRKWLNQNGSKDHKEKKPCKGFVTLKGYAAERKGEREEMQDAHIIIDNFTASFEQLPSEVKPAWKDGTTATCVLLVDKDIFVTNLGDSRAILCRFKETSGKLTSVPLVKEHNPTQYEERMRIQKAGGTVRDGRVMGVLGVSRSIGDGQYKRCGVISVPDVRRCPLTSNDRFILLACDGLFKVFCPEEAILFVTAILEDETLVAKTVKTSQDVRFEAACNRLANEAVRRGSADNVTIILVAIGH